MQYCNLISKIIMFGSLSEFIEVKDKFSSQQLKINKDNDERSMFFQQKRRHNSLLDYHTQDKSIYLNSLINKNKRRKKAKAIQLLQETLKQKQTSESKQKPPKEHWIQHRSLDKDSLKRKHKLLRAIVKTKQLEAQDNTRTLYDKSLGRIMSGYSKIKTQPVDALFPPKMMQFQEIQKQQQIKISFKKPYQGKQLKILQLQNSVKWAKKHGKNIQSFYHQLGKSIELRDQERPGKNNFQLQRQIKQKAEEEQRRGARRKFLKQIEKRLARHSANNQ